MSASFFGRTTGCLVTMVIFFVILPVTNRTYGQISFGGQPSTTDESALQSIPVITMPSFDENEFFKKITRTNPDFKGFPFARDFKVAYHPGNSGVWNQMAGDRMIWRLGFRSPGAKSMAVAFEKFNLPAGAELFIYGLGTRNYLGAFTSGNVNPGKKLTVAPIPGEVIFLEYRVVKSKVAAEDLQIGLVSHGFGTGTAKQVLLDSLAGEAGFCNVDINCPEGAAWQKEKHAVCRILVHKYLVENGDTTWWAEICSGVMVNNTRNSGRPYLLTANHCIGNSYEAEHSLFFFGYERPYCNGPDGSNRKSLSGSTLLATSDRIDFSLVELHNIPPFLFSPIYAGWSRINAPPSNTVCIHHPQGDVKKISIDNDPPLTSTYGGYDSDAFWLIQRWETGTTEIGSSGSPLFDPDHRVIGLLSGGIATCLNPVTDYFSKISVSWQNYPDSVNQLKFWLDPEGLDIAAISGLDPYHVSKQTCDTVNNLEESENLILYDYDNPDEGYWTGHNTGRYTQYAEKISNNENNTLVGVYMDIARAEYNNTDDYITLKLWTGTSYPEELISSKDLLINNFSDSTWCFAEFDSLIQVEGDFWVGYEIYYDSLTSLTDQFSLFQAENRGASGNNTAFAYKEGTWSEFNSLPPLNLTTSLAIKTVLCNEVHPVVVPEDPGSSEDQKYLAYPNPSAGTFTLKHTKPGGPAIQIRIFDLTGRLVYYAEAHTNQESLQIRLNRAVSGVYVMKINDGRSVHIQKITIAK